MSSARNNKRFGAGPPDALMMKKSSGTKIAARGRHQRIRGQTIQFVNPLSGHFDEGAYLPFLRPLKVKPPVIKIGKDNDQAN
jgi:hypothetical protein